MSLTKTLAEKLASAPTATSLSGLSMLLVNGLGELNKKDFPIQMQTTENGVGFLQGSQGITLFHAYSKSNVSIYVWALVTRRSSSQFYLRIFLKSDTASLVYDQVGTVELAGVSDPVFAKVHFPCEIP